MRETIETILRSYGSYRETHQFAGTHLINQLFTTLCAEFEKIPAIRDNSGLIVKSSYGKGNWAKVPWVAVLDTRETSTTQQGTYFVLLFAEDGKRCQLKLAQGVTDVKNQYGRGAPEELERRASLVRDMLSDLELDAFLTQSTTAILGDGSLARLYETSTILSREYAVEELPTDEVLCEEISTLIDAYQRYIERRPKEVKEPQPRYTSATGTRTWAISPGEGGKLWDEFLARGEIAIGWEKVSNLSSFGTQKEIYDELVRVIGGNPKNDALCCYQFAHEMAVGDIVVAKTGRKNILGMGRITSDYFWDGSRPAFRHRRGVEWLRTDQTEFPGTGTAIKTLTEITPYPTFIELVNDYLDIETPSESEPSEEQEEFEDYSIESIIEDGSFLDHQELNQLIDRLQIKKNIILQGPPGTGKTWLAKRLGYALLGQKNPERIKVVQFHANITYEDFVRGYRPTSEGKLALVDGAFMEAIEDARNSSQPYVVVIEEVNRGNPAQIFGEMLTLLEADKRSANYGMELSYKRKPRERVHIPANLYVIGTMNIADRSLALVDLALRRRFAFIDLVPQLNETWREWLINQCGFTADFVSRIEAKITTLNEKIRKDERLGAQFRVGHSYVTPPENSNVSDPERWFLDVIETELAPLLLEYWFDDPQSADKAIQELRLGF